METAIGVVRRLGGMCRTQHLRAAGFDARGIAAAVASGSIERARVGHFVAPELPTAVKQAVRVGGRLTCVSAAQAMGLRVLAPDPMLHVEVHEHASRLRRPTDPHTRMRGKEAGRARPQPVVLHWTTELHRGGVLPPVEDVLAQVLTCVDPLAALCVLDAARESVPWNAGPPMLDDAGFDRLLTKVPLAAGTLARRSSTLSNAIGETVARIRLAEAGIHARPQGRLPGGFRADLLIGQRLVFECFGHAAHSDGAVFEEDHARLTWLRACGYSVLTFTHRQILHDWPSVLAAVRASMRRGDHLAA